MEASKRVLIVEDEPQIRKFLRISLEAHGYEVMEVRSGEDGLRACMAASPDLIILDLGLPDMDGKDFIGRIREWSQVPVVVLSVRADESEKVMALDLGANDYVTKPFGIGELMARIRVLMRDQEKVGPEESSIVNGGLEIDLLTRQVQVNGQAIHLSKKEYALLHLLASHVGQVLTHQQILRHVWGPSQVGQTHYLRVLVGHLRNKLGDDPSRPLYILTEQGVGYRMAVLS